MTLHNVFAVHRGCAVHQGMFSTLGDIIEYTGRCSVQWGDTTSTPGRYHDECGGGYHEYPGDVQYTGVSIQIQLFPNDLPPHHYIPPLYS